MNNIHKLLLSALNYVKTFLLFGLVAGFTGLVGGFIGGAFHKSVEFATEYRGLHSSLIYFLPIAGVVIVFLYHRFNLRTDPGTNRVISSVRSDEEIPIAMAPLIFMGTFLTHLFGGSAGREGAALQLGGSIGFSTGRLFRLDEKNMPLVVMCGMSAVFSALFGTPLTAVFFAMEVISVGIIYYSALVPCIVSSYIALYISSLFGNEPVRLIIDIIPKTSPQTIISVMALGAFAALLSIFFCVTMKYTHIYFEKTVKNGYLRALLGGAIIVGLTMVVGNTDYNGAGMNVIRDAVMGKAVPYAFFVKIIFTAITISAGFKGGEIVPTFFIGATFGCAVAPLVGLPAGFGAAIGLVCLFVGVVNSPVASIFLAIELFGAHGMLLYAIGVSVSYMLSGYYSLYSSQKIIYSKLRAEYININAK